MPEAAQHGDGAAVAGQPPVGGTGAFAGLGVFSGLGAVAAKSCCIFPLVLASAGLGGAWLSQELMAFTRIFSERRGYLSCLRGYLPSVANVLPRALPVEVVTQAQPAGAGLPC